MEKFFMLCFIPLVMIICGLICYKFPPKKINHWFGYRTKTSMKNQQNWNYAHKTCGAFWLIAGIIVLIISLIIFLITLKCDNIQTLETVTIIVNAIIMLAVIPYTEIKLKKLNIESANK